VRALESGALSGTDPSRGECVDRSAPYSAEAFDRRALRSLHASLQKITEVLASELARPTLSPPSWSASEWAIARAVAAMHGVSALLVNALRWDGPLVWTEFLQEQKAQTTKRWERIQELLQLIDAGARRRGVMLTALKGAALHATGIYGPGERPMADVDLLVPEAQSAQATQTLVELGYRLTHRTWKHQVFERPGAPPPVPLGEHADNDIKIELHCHIREALPLRALDISAAVLPRTPEPGLRAYPSDAALLLHLLLHAAGALTSRELRLLHLHDIARVSSRLTHDAWTGVLSEAARLSAGRPWWVFPTLALVARYYACIPAFVLTQAARDCSPVLRRVYRHRTLGAASLSHLWVSALPAIAWAQSPLELLKYVAMRVKPTRETLQRRKTLARVQPRVSGSSWAQMSQGERMLRWLIARPARHETLQPVCAAFRAGY
jgi:hypothetical protein